MLNVSFLWNGTLPAGVHVQQISRNTPTRRIWSGARFDTMRAVTSDVIYKWLKFFLNSSLSVVYETPLVAWKYSLDLDWTIRLTREEDDSVDEGRSLSNLSVIETGQVALWDLARRDVCPYLYWSFLRFRMKTDMYSLQIETSLTDKVRISPIR